ncbi:MAG: asparaginase [Candidatus Tyrphobacter sp.]
MRFSHAMGDSSWVDAQHEGVLVEVRRGIYVESMHRVSFCVARSDGEVLCRAGDVDLAFPIRSLAKPFIASELVRSGAADAFVLTDAELALSAGSHDGEARHIAAVRGVLLKLGVTDDVLRCGSAMEGTIVVGPPIANNCSGKHAAVIALCRHLGFDVAGYIEPEHPVQIYLQRRLREAFGRAALASPLAVDGCGMPIFGAPLRDVAAAYARFGCSREPAVARVRAAIAARPEYVGGWDGNLDSSISAESGGAVFGKIGAEGLHADALIPAGLGLAVKVLDGNSRALGPILARVFVEYAPDGFEESYLARLARPVLYNAAGSVIGDVRLRAGTVALGGLPMRRSRTAE